MGKYNKTGRPPLDAALKEMTAWVRRRDHRTDRDAIRSITRPLYHYTPSVIAPTILSTSQLRLTDYRDLKNRDEVEIEHGLSLAREVLIEIIDELRGTGRYSETAYWFCLGLLERLRATKISEVFDCFVGCFTRHVDSEDHWKDFGKGGTGTAIGMKPSYFHAVKQKLPKNLANIILAQPVVYSRDEVIARHRAVIDKALELIGRPEVLAEIDQLSRPMFLKEMAWRIAGVFLLNAICTKRDGYQGEAEIRICVLNSIDRLTSYVRVEGGRRYIYTDLPSKRMISDVIVGFHAAKPEVAKIRRALKQKGFPLSKLSRSTVIV